MLGLFCRRRAQRRYMRFPRKKTQIFSHCDGKQAISFDPPSFWNLIECVFVPIGINCIRYSVAFFFWEESYCQLHSESCLEQSNGIEPEFRLRFSTSMSRWYVSKYRNILMTRWYSAHRVECSFPYLLSGQLLSHLNLAEGRFAGPQNPLPDKTCKLCYFSYVSMTKCVYARIREYRQWIKCTSTRSTPFWGEFVGGAAE